MIYGIDAVHGHNNVYNATIFPHNVGLGATRQVMVPINYKEFINDLINLVKNNVVPMDHIDDAAGRILLVKFTMGLFENPLADFSLFNELGSQDHRDLAREAVRKSVVLLKNGKNGNITDPVIPLPKKVSKILVAQTLIKGLIR
ncbi:hypothetical protein C1H46_029436 [Malus baccata]|uniref:Glycoside hydrolase family 3 N-terminal domain-containing protein n=1 Tax=Malus baccata TaxID=106549 RepID=A0A540LEU6_MALBA|nr:hypothetical protein C1H46_029436 [Malus baccata]